MWNNIWKWICGFVREIYNFITDLAVPFLSFLSVVVSILPVPLKYVKMVKIAEEFMKRLGRTRQEVENTLKYKRR